MNTVILTLLIIFFLLEFLLIISTHYLVNFFKLKNEKEFSLLMVESSKNQLKYENFNEKINSNKKIKTFFLIFTISNTAYWCFVITACFTPIFYVSLGIIIMVIIKSQIKKNFYWFDKIISLLIITSGIWAF